MTTPTQLDPLAQLMQHEQAGDKPIPDAPTASPAAIASNQQQYSDPLSELQRHEQNDQQTLARLQGEHAATVEQDGYAARIKSIAPNTNTATSDVLHDVGNRVADIFRGAEAGPIHAFGELEATTAELLGAGGFADQIRYGLSHGEYDYASNAAGTQEQSGLGSAAQGITQFMTAFLPATAGLKVLGVAGGLATAGGVAAGGVSQGLAFDPHDPRLSNLVQSVPALRNPITEFLASQPGDSAAYGFLKNTLEGLAAGGVSEAVIGGLGAVLRGMRATNGVADTVKAVAEAKPTPVVSSGIEVSEGAMTDEQRQAFQKLAGDSGRSDDSGERTQVLSGADQRSAGNAAQTGTTVYRGGSRSLSDADFTPEALGKNTGNPSSGLGVWFTSDEGEAARWGNVSEHQLFLKNPKEINAEDFAGYDSLEEAQAHQQELIGQGHDGLVMRNKHLGNPGDHFVAFSPEALKAPEVSPYEPPAITKADTATPQGAAEASGPFNAKATVDAEAQRLSMSVPAEKQAEILQALRDGRYADVPAMLDDTHRTIPWDQLSDGANLKELFNATEGVMGTLIKQAHGTGAVSSDTIAQLAKDIGGDVKSVSQLFTDTTAQGGLAARITAGYNIMVASARQLKELATAAHALNADTPAGKQAILDFQKQLELHAAIVGQVRQSSSEIGRALYAHRSLKASSEVALNNLGELTGTVLGPNAVKKFLKSVTDGNLADINAAADATRGKGFLGILKEVAQGGMLSSVGTQVRNLAGNVSGLIVRAIEPYIAATVGNVRGVFMPNAEHMTYRAALAHTAGIVDGVKDSFPLFIQALAKEQAVSPSGAPIIRAIYKDTSGLTGVNLTLAQVYNRVGQVIRYPGRLMGAIDSLNRGIGYQSDLSARAYTQAATEADAKGLAGDARDTFLGERIADLKANPPPDIKAASQDAGLYQSFQEAARTETGENIATALNSHPLVKLLVAPFVHRPMNMLRQTLVDYNPILAGFNPKLRAQIMGGTMDTDTALARLALGAGGMAWAYHMAESGNLTGPRMGYNNTQALDGVPAWSIKIGDRYFRYDSVDPIGMWLAIGAGTHEAIQRHYDPNDQDTVNQLASIVRVGTQVMGQAAIDKSFMKSMDELMNAFGSKDPNKADLLFQRLVNDNAMKVIPFSGLLRSVAQSLDPFRKDSSGPMTDALKANFPILSKEVPDRLDVLGRPIAIPSGNTTWFNPFGGANASADPLNQTLASLAVGIRPPPRTIDGITLDQDQHNEIVRTATQSPLFRGETLEQALRMLTTSDMWHQYDHTDDKGIAAHTQLVQSFIDEAYGFAKQKFTVDHKDFSQAGIAKIIANAKHYQPVETPQ